MLNMETQYKSTQHHKEVDKVSSEAGELLRKKREEMNLSLKEVETMTSIRVNYLRALEEGTTHLYISHVYAQGFLVQYSRFLGIDPDELKRSYPSLFNKVSVNQEFTYGIGTLEVRTSSNAGVKWIPNTTWLISALGIIGVAWALAKYFNLI